jgi:hypothetical protein
MKQTLSWSSLAGVLVFLAISVGISWALGTEMIILFDLSQSCTEGLEENKRGVEALLHTLPGETWIMILAITESSFSRPSTLLSRQYIPSPAYLLDSRPLEARKRIAAEWRKQNQSLKPDRPATDILGAISYSALFFPGDSVEKKNRVLILFSDMRQNTQGIDLNGGLENAPQTISKVRKLGLVVPLRGVKVWALGVHTRNVNHRFFSHLHKFWFQFFQEAGASLEAFSPSPRWAVDGQAAHPR